MPLEHFKTQVLLLHSQQSTLDSLSAGFGERYAVHLATSGSEALTTLGETPIHVIVSAQDLPGMSGLEALREAKKRSPDTIGILLAGDAREDGLEALVGDQEVFQIVRGAVTPDSLGQLVDQATKRVRLLALAESANDHAANVDEPVGEHIVMETSENGAAIISDGTAKLRALRPQGAQVVSHVGGRDVDVLVLTKDEDFLDTIRESARGLHNVHHAATTQQAEGVVKEHKVGVLVTDAAMAGPEVETLTARLRGSVPRLVAIVAGRRDDGEMLMDLINRGHVYRFLLKPVSPGRARLAIEASVKHHLEAADSAFRNKAAGDAPVPGSKPAQRPPGKASGTARPPGTPRPAGTPARTAGRMAGTPSQTGPTGTPAQTTQTEAPGGASPGTYAGTHPGTPTTSGTPNPAGTSAPSPASAKRPARPAPSARRAPPGDTAKPEGKRPEAPPGDPGDRLSGAFGESGRFRKTISGIAATANRSLGRTTDNLKIDEADRRPVPAAVGTASGILTPARIGAIAAALIVVAVLGWWLAAPEAEPPASVGTEAADDITPSVVEIDVPRYEALPQSAKPSSALPPWQAALDLARAARAAGAIVAPPGENAIEQYIAARELAPGNAEILAELDATIDDAIVLAEQALLNQAGNEAAAALRMVRLANPEHPRLLFLDAQVAQLELRARLDQARVAIRESRFEDAAGALVAARRVAGPDRSEIEAIEGELESARSEQRVDEVLTLAAQRLEEDSLTAPANDNARYYYELALSNDAENVAARQGLAVVASKLVLKAREAIDNGALDDAERLLQDATALDPQSGDLAASTQALTNARAAAEEQARLEAERLAAAEEQAATGSLAAPLSAGSDGATAPGGGAPDPTANARSAEGSTGTGGRTVDTVPGPAEFVAISSLQRTNYVAPRYPRLAQRRGITGWVDISFSVLPDGTVADIAVMDSDPGDIFSESAVEAVAEWRFEPPVENGVPAEKRVAVRMMFNLQ